MPKGVDALMRFTCDYLDVVNKDDKNGFECQARQTLFKERRRKDKVNYLKWMEEGKEEKALEIALYLLKRGISVETVAETTGLKFSIIKRLM